MKVEKLLEQISYIELFGSKHRNFNHITLDSRLAKEESLFVAIKGFKTDGHKYIDMAIEQGCKIIVHSEDVDKVSGVSYIEVKDSRSALAEISKAFYNNPSGNMTVVGITGTNGKTTTTFMLESILNHAKIKTASIGSLGLKREDGVINFGKTTPEANILQDTFSKLCEDDYRAVVMEVSSHALELKRVEGVDFDYGAFTNLTYEHLELHGSMENYYNTKKKLFFMTKRENFINVDDQYGKRLYEELKENYVPVISYGMSEGCEIVGEIREMNIDHSTFIYREGDKEIELTLPMAGKYNIYNALCAVAIAIRMGVPIGDIKEGLRNFETPEGRYEVVENDKNLNLIIDFAHTSDGMRSIISSVKESFDKNCIVVFGVSGARTPETQEEIGRVVGENADYSIITMDDEVEMPIGEVSKNIIRGMEESKGKYEYIEDRPRAIQKAIEMATEDDVILFLGKGNEKFIKRLEGKKDDYDEKREVLKALKKIRD
ncbi:UDP-N-acetylmuramoyl-L-alanyl-D-glutamate--2,6-diaminopimelate ligase [Lagierella sp.]|uniref:UDP-N-acetylmuramoyl-L-alanyl-D-glutamate--2, 6-diaminopimelate ligase n=1 Tax=Lagierella sp. TaxID=2849657 RepID=UPI0026157192|nr:UDP-N-acetylmuramoyl-L-alanyl-D-glutamate--2,6-diaminopimelate ligase [Lagierella sp.]